jgi:uncharacterized paraquat-inducible protein A
MTFVKGGMKWSFKCHACQRNTSTTILEKAQSGLCNRCALATTFTSDGTNSFI